MLAVKLVTDRPHLFSGFAAIMTRKTPKIKVKPIEEDCPYQYVLNIYGRNHFAGFVRKLSPDLEITNPKKWNMVLEIMDALHFCLILVDDVHSPRQKCLSDKSG